MDEASYSVYGAAQDYRPGEVGAVSGLQEQVQDMELDSSSEMGQSEPSAASVFSHLSSPRVPVAGKPAQPDRAPPARSIDTEGLSGAHSGKSASHSCGPRRRDRQQPRSHSDQLSFQFVCRSVVLAFSVLTQLLVGGLVIDSRISPKAANALSLQRVSVDDLIDSLCGKSDAEIRQQLSKLEKRLNEVASPVLLA